MWIFFILIIVAFSVWFFIMKSPLKINKQVKLPSHKIKSFREKKWRIENSDDPKLQIIDYDLLYNKILLNLNYQWDFIEILNQNLHEINNQEKVIELHKLSERLIKDFDIPDKSSLKLHAKEYEIELNYIIKKIS